MQPSLLLPGCQLPVVPCPVGSVSRRCCFPLSSSFPIVSGLKLKSISSHNTIETFGLRHFCCMFPPRMSNQLFETGNRDIKFSQVCVAMNPIPIRVSPKVVTQGLIQFLGKLYFNQSLSWADQLMRKAANYNFLAFPSVFRRNFCSKFRSPLFFLWSETQSTDHQIRP